MEILMVSRRAFLLLILMPGIWAVPLAAANPGMVFGFKSYGVDQGLTAPTVTDMAQDLQGSLWVGTEDGLYRLEGDRFRRFGTEDGLPANHVESMAPASPSGMWFVTVKGAVLWDGRQFRRPSAFGFRDTDERAAVPVAGGGLILSDSGTRKRFFSASDGRGFRELNGLPWDDVVSCARYDRVRNRLVVALRNVLWIWDGHVWKSRRIIDADEQNKPIRAVLIDRRGRLWIRLVAELIRLDTFDAAPVLVPTPEPLSLVNRCYIDEDEFGRFWTNTAQGLIWVSETGSGALGDREGLPLGGALALLVDDQGTLWIGGAGVFKLQGDSLWTAATRRQGLPAEVVWSVRRTRDGRAWAGTANGLAYVTPQDWRLVPGTEQCQVTALYEDATGVLWVGHDPAERRATSLMQVRPGTAQIRIVRVDGVTLSGVAAIAETPGGDLWLAANWVGLVRAVRTPSGVRAAVVRIPGWPVRSLVLKVAPDGAGGLWVAGSPGAAHWDGHSWAVLPDGSLADQAIISLLSLGPGSAWLAPQHSKGIVRVERTGGRLTIVEKPRPDDPLSQVAIIGLEQDARGVIWMATSGGLLRWDGGRVERFGRNAGLPGDDVAQNALWVEPDGDVWAGLSVGLAHGDMNRRRAPQAAPAVTILECLDGQGHDLNPAGPSPVVSWRGRAMAFRYGPRGSLWTEGIRFQVRLVGLEDAWHTTDVSEARYPGLDNGHYRFDVRTLSPTLGPGQTSSFTFQVVAPWWRRWWAQIIWALMIAALAVLAIPWRTTVLRRRNERLEELISARTGELEQANIALREASLIDPLTGLHNRRFLTATLPEEQARLRRMFRTHLQQGRSPLDLNEDMILFLADLDHFKRVNDTFGHAAGDLVLQDVARVLRSVTRTSDTLVRWGGEEFLLVAKRSARESAYLIAGKICQAMREHVFVLQDGRTLRCTVSVGFAAFPILEQRPEAFTWEDTLRLADQGLYAAKQAGRDGWAGVYTAGPLDAPELGTRLLEDLDGLVGEGLVHAQSSYPAVSFNMGSRASDAARS
jgi:diguanylate cyclase (GGDEF)-like protein